MTTDQPASSLEEARDRLHKAIDDRADCLVIESLVDGVVAAARGGEFIRAVEALMRESDEIDPRYRAWESVHPADGGVITFPRFRAAWDRLRVLSQGGEGNGDNT